MDKENINMDTFITLAEIDKIAQTVREQIDGEPKIGLILGWIGGRIESAILGGECPVDAPHGLSLRRSPASPTSPTDPLLSPEQSLHIRTLEPNILESCLRDDDSRIPIPAGRTSRRPSRLNLGLNEGEIRC